MTDATFYQRHYGGLLKLGQTSLATFSEQMLAPGKRYHLLMEDLQTSNPQGGTLAELGCGGAEALLIIERQYELDRLIGLDIVTGDDAEGRSTKVEYRNANLNGDWPLANCSVDYLVAMMVIEHLFDPFHSFKEIRRVLSQEGRAYINVPLVTSIRHRLQLLRGILPSTSISYNDWFRTEEFDGGHLHWFSLRSLSDLCGHCGLQIDYVSGVGRFHRLKGALPGLLASEINLRISAG